VAVDVLGSATTSIDDAEFLLAVFDTTS
jgi:hypothetical protein